MTIEGSFRLGLFFGALVLFAALSALFPRRPRKVSWWRRWLDNIGIVTIDTLIVRLLFPAAAVGFAMQVNTYQWGLMHWLPLANWFAVLLTIVLLDLLIYWQHVVFHHVPILWRLHKVHHTDLDFDTTTGFRFHPIEIVLSMLVKCLAILLLGAPALGVLLFEIILSTAAMFNHSNLRLPLSMDRWLRKVIVTPDMHRVHHSSIREETDSNFGFNLSLWDRLFGSYRAQPKLGHDKVEIGLTEYRHLSQLRLPRLLLLPFEHKK